MTPRNAPSRATSTGEAPDAATRSAAAAGASVKQLTLGEQPDVAADDERAVDVAFGAEAGQRRTSAAAASDRFQARRRASVRWPRRWDVPIALRRRRRRPAVVVGRATGRGMHRRDAQRAARQRAGLVERDGRDARQPLQMGAAFDQDAAARCSRERRNDGDRRRDHQRTGTRHDQQDERTIEPDCRRRRRTSGGTSCDEHGEGDHRRRIPAREAIDELLRRGALGLRRLRRGE